MTKKKKQEVVGERITQSAGLGCGTSNKGKLLGGADNLGGATWVGGRISSLHTKEGWD